MNIMQLTLLVLLAGVGSVISGRLALPQLACCTSYNLDLGRVYIPLDTDPGCRRIISEIPYSCPMGVLPVRARQYETAQGPIAWLQSTLTDFAVVYPIFQNCEAKTKFD
ncbi:hypothetical protein MJO28_005354 [Puccinia striiformis f. sp. tritici]|uniref:Uncharacterized protein n=1 Tax=Puccinia striiformis f. sp. tritici TaxID=168172 RepID=A0ACC0ELG5_9BASI|nr:hypothetical protein MJO28_005354 [Puccinia striiformis f. sp. tritici]KAI7960339.1 hypothetical protein MJO29_005407 [Puccinia striiformis f. sp. tritici]